MEDYLYSNHDKPINIAKKEDERHNIPTEREIVSIDYYSWISADGAITGIDNEIADLLYNDNDNDVQEFQNVGE